MIQFKKSDSKEGSYFVYKNDKLVGSVLKIQRWGNDPSWTEWKAYAKGREVGHARTRKAAAELLPETR